MYLHSQNVFINLCSKYLCGKQKFSRYSEENIQSPKETLIFRGMEGKQSLYQFADDHTFYASCKDLFDNPDDADVVSKLF